jgi:two-component system KDP operon response regulator KdpE
MLTILAKERLCMDVVVQSPYTITLDDDPMVSKLIEKATGYPSKGYVDPEVLLKEMGDLDPIAVFVDIDLGTTLSGLDVIPSLRRRWPFTAILVITASTPHNVIKTALSSGADDFAQKPIIPDEIHARLQLRLSDWEQKASKKILKFGDITIDPAHRCVAGPKAKRYISPTEISLLSVLVLSEGELVEKDILKQRCWGDVNISENAFHRKLHAVRSLLKEVTDTVVIQSKYGIGFFLKSISNSIKIAS